MGATPMTTTMATTMATTTATTTTKTTSSKNHTTTLPASVSSPEVFARNDGYPVASIPPQDLSIKMLRDAIPAHCFERNIVTSLRHLASDLIMILAMGLAIHWVDTHAERFSIPSYLLNLVFWPSYWWFQGAVMTGVWVLAHECGHQSFSPWKSVNDAFGLVLHSALLVPYHSWRLTHAQHHKKTNHMTLDQVFVPSTKEQYNGTHGISEKNGIRKYRLAIQEAMEETPLGDLFGIIQMWVVGWWAYLLINVSSQRSEFGASHYNPRASIFSKRDYWDIVISDVFIAIALAILGTCIYNFGFFNVAKYYIVPYMIVNMWLVTITYLQHSDPAIPHYTPKEFSFVRGALCSVDRNYGIYNVLHHHIGDTHVVHHLFSQMPFYHAKEATRAVKKVLGDYYYYDSTPIFTALRRSWAYCKFIDERDGDIMFYRNYKMEHLAQS